MVLTRRRADLRRHAGEISFPGGRQDPEDADLAETALREAEEEIGLTRARRRLLGELPAISTFATNYVIHPFVGTIPAGQSWRVSPREVDAVLELPLRRLCSRARTRTHLERRGISFETDAYIARRPPHLGRHRPHPLRPARAAADGGLARRALARLTSPGAAVSALALAGLRHDADVRARLLPPIRIGLFGLVVGDRAGDDHLLARLPVERAWRPCAWR